MSWFPVGSRVIPTEYIATHYKFTLGKIYIVLFLPGKGVVVRADERKGGAFRKDYVYAMGPEDGFFILAPQSQKKKGFR